MSTPRRQPFERSQADTLAARLGEPRRFLQVVAGARQVGKTTLAVQVLARLDVPSVFISADEPTLGDAAWLAAQWERARIAAADAGKVGAVLALDEVQKIPGWSETVNLIETTIARDVLLMTRVDRPALLRRLFELGCRYSGQVLSYTKMLGQLQDAGNTTTLAHYLDLLGGAGMLTGLQMYSGKAVRQRGSSPKLQVLNTALMTAQSGLSPAAFPGLGAFAEAFKPKRTLLVGGDGISLEEFLTKPVEHWLRA
jgi:predicted AAA+ superfamily ATPase